MQPDPDPDPDPDLFSDWDDDLLSPGQVQALLERTRELQRDLWWSPAGRAAILKHSAGAELRHRSSIAGRDVEDVPLP